MDQTVALLLPTQCVDIEHMRLIGREHGYFLVQGIENGPEEVRGGLNAFVKSRDREFHVVFISTSNGDIESWDILTQLHLLRTAGSIPPFFEFMGLACTFLLDKIDSFYFLAASEWDAQDEAMFFSGTCEQLIGLLSLLKTFDLPLWRPGNRDVHETPRYPLIFELHCDNRSL